MSDESVRIKRNLPDNGVRTGSELRLQGVHGLRVRGASLFDAGVHAWGKAHALAEYLETQTSVLSEMRSGKRPVPFHAVLALLDSPEAAELVIGGECEIAGFAAPRLKTTIVINSHEAGALADVRAIHGEDWDYYGAKLASKRYGASLELLDQAIDDALRLGK